MLTEAFIKYKKLIVVLICFILAVFAVISLWGYLRYGVISVSTEKGNIITITELGDDNKPKEKLFSKSGQDSLAVRVSPGTYIVSVGKANFINKTVAVKARHKDSLSLTPPRLKAYEPVVGMSASEIAVNNDDIAFVNNGGGVISRLNSTNALASFPQEAGFRQSKWASPDFGAGISLVGKLFIYDNGVISRFNSPEPDKGFNSAGLAVTANKKVYLSIGQNIYKLESGELKKIYTASSSITELAATDNYITLISPPGNGEVEVSGSEQNRAFVENIDTTGKPIAKKEILGNKAIWSPDGNKLLVINFFGRDSFGSNKIYDKNLNVVKVLPNTRMSLAVWVDNNTLAYNISSSIWSYDVEKEEAKTVVYLSPQYILSGLAADSASGHVYFIYGKPSAGSAVARVSLSGQAFDSSLAGLSVFLPVSLDTCTITYANFKGTPAILMQTSKKTSECREQAQIELAQDKLDPGAFKYVRASSPGTSD